jgi:hypothetical protein
VQQALFDNFLYHTPLQYGARIKWMPVYDENGFWDGKTYEPIMVPPKTPWGAESFDIYTDLIWTADFAQKIIRAERPEDVAVVIGDLFTFGAFATPSEYYMLNQKYFAMKKNLSDEEVREWLDGTEEGQKLQRLWDEHYQPAYEFTVDPFTLGERLLEPEEIRKRWFQIQSPEAKSQFFDAWDQKDLIESEWDFMMDNGLTWTPEQRRVMWAAREAHMMEFYRRHPYLWYYQGMGMDDAEFAEFWDGHLQDVAMGEFYDRFAYDLKPSGKKAGEKWEAQRQQYLAEHPNVWRELNAVTSDYDRHRKLVDESIQTAIATQDIIKDLRDGLYDDPNGKRKFNILEQANDFLNLAFDQDVFGNDAAPGEDPRWRTRLDSTQRALRAAAGDKEAKKEALYTKRLDAVAKKAVTDGQFDYLKWLKIMKNNPDLKRDYFERNPGKEKKFWRDMRYMKFWDRFGKLADKGRWDLAWETWENAPSEIRNRLKRKDPAKFRKMEQDGAYHAYMKRWIGLFDSAGAKAAMEYFDSLPSWAKERYYSNNPGKRMNSGASSAYVQNLNHVFGLIDNGDWDAAEDYWNRMPAWQRQRYYNNNPDSTLFRGKGGPSSGGWPDAKYKKYVGYLNKWDALMQDGKFKEAEKYYKSLPAWVRETHEKSYADRKQIAQELKLMPLIQEYIGADRAEQDAMLQNNPRLARWINDNAQGAAWRDAVYNAYRNLDDPWLKRVYREKYPEIFSKEARGERYKNEVFDTLKQHPELSDLWMKHYERIADTLMEAQKYAVSRPKEVLPDHEVHKRGSHTGFSAEEVRLNTRARPRRAWQTFKRMPNLETAIR